MQWKNRHRALAAALIAGGIMACVPAAVRAEAAQKRRPVRVEGTAVDGPLDRASARSTVEKQAKRFDKCYPRQKKGQSKSLPRTPGTVALRLFVEKTGRVVAATVERPLGEYPDVTRCLMRNAMNARFRKAARHSTVRFSVRSGNRPYGLLGMLRSAQPPGGVSNIFSGGSVGSGLFKSTGTIGRGSGGLGLRGTGGSSGTGGGTIGIGNIRSVGARSPTARVRTGTIAVRGSLSREVVRRGVGRQMGAIRRCYQRRLIGRPSLSGRMTLTFVIDSRGTVSRVNASSTLSDPAVSSCVTGVFRRLTFPSPTGGGIVTVTYPLTFSTSP